MVREPVQEEAGHDEAPGVEVPDRQFSQQEVGGQEADLLLHVRPLLPGGSVGDLFPVFQPVGVWAQLGQGVPLRSVRTLPSTWSFCTIRTLGRISLSSLC